MKFLQNISIVILLIYPGGKYFSQIHNDSLAPTADSHVFSGSTGTNYGTALTTIVGVNSTPAHYRYLTNFNISGLNIPSNAVIYSAELILTPAGSGEGTVNSTDLYLETVTASWAENTVTYANQPTTSTVNQVTTSSLVNGKRTFNITTLVQNIVNGTTVNYGWRIRRNPENIASSLSTYATKDAVSSTVRPKLKIKWYVPMTITAATINHCVSTSSNDGSIAPTISGGSGGFTYTWKNSAGTTVGTSSSLSNMPYGWYGLKVTGSLGDVYYKAFIVGVRCQNVTINFNPSGDFVDDATVSSQTPTLNKGGTTDLFDHKYLRTTTWHTQKGLLRFNLWMDSALIINQANLQLYGKAHLYTNSNASYLKKITQNWTENGVTWNTLPSSETTNQVSIPWSTSATQNYLTLNTTAFWNNWKMSNTTNYGMLLELQSSANAEAKMSFHSSDTTLASIRPAISFIVRAEKLVSGTVTAGSSSICSGSTTLLTLSGSTSGSTFQWQKSTDNVNFTSISGATSSTYTTLSSTTVNTYYRCVVSLGSCTPANSASILITIKPVPTVTVDNTTFCTGTSVTLTGVPSIGGGTFLWSTDATSASIIVAPSITTEYSVVYTLNGCASQISRGVVSVCTSSATFNDSTELGTVSVSINEAPGKVGPYHFQISQSPIPEISSVYHLIKDSIYGGTLDSTTFFKGSTVPTNYTFTNLKMGRYYVSSFDSRGVRIFDREILVLPQIDISDKSNITISGNEITSTGTNAYTMIDLYVSNNENGEFGFNIPDKSKVQFMGFVTSTETVSNDIRYYKYGFSIKSSGLYLIESGIEGSTAYSISNGSEIKLRIVNSLLELYSDDLLIKTISLPDTFCYKIGYSTAVSGVKTKLLPGSFSKKKFYFEVKNLHYYNCDNQVGGFNFKVMNTMNMSIPFSWTVIKDGVQIGTGGPTYNPVYNFDPSSYGPGLYEIQGVSVYNGVHTCTKKIYIGFETSWTTVINYDNLPNSFSLERNNTNPNTWSNARSENILKPGELGWIEFKPIFSNNNIVCNVLRLSTLNMSNQTPVYPEDYFIMPLKLGNAIYIYWSGPNGGIHPISNISTILLDIQLSQIKIYSKTSNTEAFIGDFSRPLNSSILLRAHSLDAGSGFDNVITSFDCAIPTIYAKLERQLSGVKYQVHSNKVFFFYDEEYASTGSLEYSVYDKNNNTVINTSAQVLTHDVGSVNREYGDNRYSLNVASLAPGAYVLEVVNEKREKVYLRFVK